MSALLEPLRRALGTLARSPGFTAVAVFVLALAIGANVAIFSLVDRFLLRPLPFPEASRLVVASSWVPRDGNNVNTVSAPDFLDWQREARGLEGLAALDATAMTLTGAARPELLQGARVSWNFFAVLGVNPVLGRSFLPEEDRQGGAPVVILTHELWTSRFGADPSLVGRSIRLDGQDRLVAGVLPPGFRFPSWISGSRFFVPMAFAQRDLQSRGNHFLQVVGRMRKGVTLASCGEEIKGIADRLAAAYPETNRNFSASVIPLQEQAVRNRRPTLLVLFLGVAFVLLIAVANLMNLTLARAAKRQKEMAIRAALGAGPLALVWHSLAESLLLALAGGALGLLLRQWLQQGLLHALGGAAQGTAPAPPDGRVLLFTLAVSLGSALLFGLLPALRTEGRRPADALKEGRGSAAAAHPRLRGILVVTETALATALLVAAGLMIRTFVRLQSVDPGFRPDHLLVTRISLPAYKYQDVKARSAFMLELQRRLEALPGVAAAAVNDTAPLQGTTSSTSFDVRGQEPADSPEAIDHHVSPGYFKAMGIPLLRGRDLLPGETDSVVVSESLARRLWPGVDPLSGAVSWDRKNQPFLNVVGVVGDVRHVSLAEPPREELYFPLAFDPEGASGERGYFVLLRGTAAPRTLIPFLEGALHDLDPDLPAGNPRPMAESLDRDREGAQARGLLLGSFAALALVLAGVGIYAVVHFLTALRTREIGVRMALGARVEDILRMVLWQGVRMVLGGVAAGAAVSLVAGRLLEAQIFGVRSWDPVTFLAVATVLGSVGLLACLPPALRAARVDPLRALRSE